MTKLYKDYVAKYKAQEEKLAQKGLAMRAGMMGKKMYKSMRRAYKDDGVTTNINKRIVSDQTYQYSYRVGQAMRRYAKENVEELKDVKIREFRQGLIIDLSAINEKLKEEIGDVGFGKQRAKRIAHDVFGS